MADASLWKVELEAEGAAWKAKQDAHAEQTAQHVDEIAELYTLVGESPSGNPSSFDTARDCLTAGSSAAYTATFAPAFSSLANGIELKVRWHTDSGADPTLNLDGLGAKAIKQPDGTAPPAASLKATYSGKVVYNATLDCWVLISNVPQTIPDMGLRKVTYHTANTTHNFQAWMKRFRVTVIGAGGGGAGDYTGGATQGCPGGGGGFAQKMVDAPYATISSGTVTVGPGGSGGAANSNGSNGGTSSWADGSNTVTANGGDGGNTTASSSVVTSNGGSASGGDLNIPGSASAYMYARGVSPGSSFWGAGQAIVAGNNPLPGGGGGAGFDGSQAGGDGGDGLVIVEEFG